MSSKKYPSFSKIKLGHAEEILKVKIAHLMETEEPIDTMIPLDIRAPTDLIQKIFHRIVECYGALGDVLNPESKEVVVQDFVGVILVAIVSDYNRTYSKSSGLVLKLLREKQTFISKNQFRGITEFVVATDTVTTKDRRYLIVIETKRGYLEHGIAQCLLALKNAFESNGSNKPVYGFITTFTDWRLLIMDKDGFRISGRKTFFLRTYIDNEEYWLRNGSILIHIIYNIFFSSKDFLNK